MAYKNNETSLIKEIDFLKAHIDEVEERELNIVWHCLEKFGGFTRGMEFTDDNIRAELRKYKTQQS
jgi:hypothetical protein